MLAPAYALDDAEYLTLPLTKAMSQGTKTRSLSFWVNIDPEQRAVRWHYLVDARTKELYDDPAFINGRLRKGYLALYWEDSSDAVAGDDWVKIIVHDTTTGKVVKLSGAGLPGNGKDTLATALATRRWLHVYLEAGKDFYATINFFAQSRL